MMPPVPRRSIASPISSIAPPIIGYQRLATRVIHRALLDLESPSLTERETARTFLAGSPMLRFWCHLAQLNAGKVVARMTMGGLERLHDGADHAGFVAARLPMVAPVTR